MPARHAGIEVRMSPLLKLLLTGAVGIAAAAAVVAIHSAVADAVGGAVAIVALIVVTRSAIQMAGDSGAPEEEEARSERQTAA
jgi:hypothetical protein